MTGQFVPKSIHNNPELVRWWVEAFRLRDRFAREEAEFFHHLWEGEQNVSMWRGAPDQGTGFATFEEVLSTLNIVSPSRYSKVRLAADKLGWDTILELGVEATMPILRVEDKTMSKVEPKKSAIDAITAQLKASKKRNGAPVSRRQAETVVSAHAPRAPRPVNTPMPDDITKLKRALSAKDVEIERLKREVALRDQQIATLQKKLASFESRGGGKK